MGVHLTKVSIVLSSFYHGIPKLFLQHQFYAKYFWLESYKLFRFSEKKNAIRIYYCNISIVCQYLNLWTFLCLWWTYHFHAFVFKKKKKKKKPTIRRHTNSLIQLVNFYIDCRSISKVVNKLDFKPIIIAS